MSRRKLSRLEGWVWCDRHGEVHEDTLDPYDYGAPVEDDEEDMRCRPSEHVAVYARLDLEPA